ncbi:MAG TPA: hypothetical protein ENJ54_04125 [Chloroflexi bacterium]|nr:hypothetical protein [Chloroflexota bacterium]
MPGFLFIGAIYVYVVGGIVTGASLYLDGDSNSTLAVQYGKSLIILLLWPIFLIASGYLRENTYKLLKELVSAALQTPPPSSSSHQSDVINKELETFLKKKTIVYVRPSLLSSPYRQRSKFTITPPEAKRIREQHRDRGSIANTSAAINSFRH